MKRQFRNVNRRRAGSRLHCECVDVSDLNPHDRDAMYKLFARHFDRTDRDRFEQDLNQKQWVLQLIEPGSGVLRGFSTQVLMRFSCSGRRLRAIFSGDTIVDPDSWGDTALIREWGRLVARLLTSDQEEELYWFLISKGYRTYRFLPVFFREFYPRFDRSTPDWAQELLEALGRKMFLDQYDAGRGIVIAAPEKERLRPELARIEPARLADPHIQFFLDHNPGYAEGDELCCLAPLTFDNLAPSGIRLLDPEHRPVPVDLRPE